MIRSGYEPAVQPDLERCGRADEFASCGVRLSFLFGAHESKAELPFEKQLESSEVRKVA
jgi:hypothetical protein